MSRTNNSSYGIAPRVCGEGGQAETGQPLVLGGSAKARPNKNPVSDKSPLMKNRGLLDESRLRKRWDCWVG